MKNETCRGTCPDCQYLKDEDYIAPVAHGYSGDRESGVLWAVFDVSDDVDQAALESEDYGELAQNLTGWAASYGGPGRVFTEDPYVARRTRSRILVKAFCGLDI